MTGKFVQATVQLKPRKHPVDEFKPLMSLTELVSINMRATRRLFEAISNCGPAFFVCVSAFRMLGFPSVSYGVVEDEEILLERRW